jgi:hypothetical protein
MPASTANDGEWHHIAWWGTSLVLGASAKQLLILDGAAKSRILYYTRE